MLQALPKTTAKAIARTLKELESSEKQWAIGAETKMERGERNKFTKTVAADRANLIRRISMLIMSREDREMVARKVTAEYLRLEQ